MDDVDALLGDLARWTSQTRAEDAARSRTRERWLRQQAEEEARFAGVALDLAESAAVVVLRTTTGRTLHGRLAVVARDFCVLRHHGSTATFVSFAAITTIRPEPGYRAVAASGRSAPVDVGLVHVLAGMAAERPRVRIAVDGGGEPVVGELRSVGADVATLRLDGDQGATLYLQLDSLRELTLLE